MSRWHATLAALAAVRVAIPLAALAAGDDALPGLPPFDYGPLWGDANDYYATARQFLSTAVGGPLLLAASVLGVALVGAGASRLRRRRPDLGWLALALVAAAAGLALALVILRMPPSGSGAFGWPLLWAVPMAPLRAVGALDPDSAFVVGVAVSLIANAVTVVATALIGRDTTGSPAVGLAAAGLYTAWPLLTGLLPADGAWENGTWHVDAGLHLYTEPASTALVAVAAAVLVRRSVTSTQLAVAGLLLGLATAVRLSNAIVALVALAYVAIRHGRASMLPLAAGGASLVAPVAAYWPIGYVPRFGNPQQFPADPFSLGYAGSSWTDSLLFTPATLALLAPLALLGAWQLRRRPRVLLLLGGWILGTAAFYSVYQATAGHPRFLFVALPALATLEAAGLVAVVSRVVRAS